MYFASKTLVNPVPAQGISLFTIFKASYSSPCLSVPFKPIKLNLSCSHPNFLYLWKKETYVRVSVIAAQQEENHPVALEEEERGLDANFNWDASEGDGEGRESVGYVEPNDEAKVYVGNLPYSVDSENLARISEEAGVVDVAEFELNDGSATVSETTISNGNPLNVKEWKVTMFQDEVAASQGIKIRRRPLTGPPLHYVGPFEFRLQNEGNTPRNILEEIVWHKDIEVSQMKEKKPLIVLKKLVDNAPPVRDFIGALKSANSRTGLPGLIAEVKKASPSRGVLREDFNPVQIAKAYEKGGAACLSVLTDEKYFQGSFENLEAIRKSGVQCPLLCKEFVIDAWQIFYARVKGADAILLIAAVLPDLDIKYMIKICKLLGLTALVEVHDVIEMDRVLEIDGIELIGINNRDLGTFKVDITNTKKLLEGERGQRILEKGIIVVGESGLFTPADIAYVQEAGIKAVLVGESIVKQKDPRAGITQLFGEDISS